MALALAAATTAAASDPFEAQKTDQERQHQDALLMSELLGQYANAQQGGDGDRAAFAHAATGVRLATADCTLDAHNALTGRYGLTAKHPHGRMFNFKFLSAESVLQSSTAMPAAIARATARDQAACRQGISKRWMKSVLKSSEEHNADDYNEMQALLQSGRLLFYRRRDRNAYSSVSARSLLFAAWHPHCSLLCTDQRCDCPRGSLSYQHVGSCHGPSFEHCVLSGRHHCAR
jgi:hypothetical protein